jgi:DNA polymerase-1
VAYDAIAKTLHVFLMSGAFGVPFDARRLQAIQDRVGAEVERLRLEVEGLAPTHPDGGEWVWGNKNKPDAEDQHGNLIGRNGALRALETVGVELPNLQETTLLGNRDRHPLAKTLQKYYAATGAYNKYARMISDFYEDGHIFTQAKVAGAVTSRVLYADPNVQGFDKKKTGEYRACVRAPEGYSIVKGDFAQQELRIAAYFSGDPDLLAAFETGEDVYMRVAEKIVGRPVERGTEEGERARAAAKRAVLGYLYGLGPKKYRENVYEDTGEEVSLAEAERDREAFRAAYPGVYRWQKAYGSHKTETGRPKPDMWETRSVRGWRRVVAGQYERRQDGKPARWIPKYTDRLNGPIQSTAGDILYLTLGELDADLGAGRFPGTRFLFSSHDELVLLCREKDAAEVAAWLKLKMVEAFEEVLGPGLGGPRSVEVGAGPSWGETR